MGDAARMRRRRLKLFKEQDGLCYYCGEPMVLCTNHKGGPPVCLNMATIEHFDDKYSSLRGTFIGVARTALVCWKCNNNASKERESLIPVDELRKRSGKKLCVGDTVKVVKAYAQERRAYPFYPDLVDKIGVITRIQTETTITRDVLEEPIYWVKFDPFKVGFVPEGQSVYGYEPTEFRKRTIWHFCGLSQIKKHKVK